jgi:hypothetical protein
MIVTNDAPYVEALLVIDPLHHIRTWEPPHTPLRHTLNEVVPHSIGDVTTAIDTEDPDYLNHLLPVPFPPCANLLESVFT